MNRNLYLLIAPLLTSSGVVFAQPSWDEGESFGDFREEWNGWVESVPAQDRVHVALVELIDDFRDERLRELDPQSGMHVLYVLQESRPWNEYWGYRHKAQGVYQLEFDALSALASRARFAASIPVIVDDPDLDQESEYLPSFWVERYCLNTNAPIRDAVRYLVTDAVYHAFEGRPNVAIERFEAASKMCAFTLELPTELGYLTEIAVRALLRETILDALRFGPDVFDDAQLARLQRLLIADLSTNYETVWELEQRVVHEDWGLHFESMAFARTNRELRNMFIEHAGVYVDFGFFSTYLSAFDAPDPDADIPLAKLSDQVAVQSRVVDAMLGDLAANPVTHRETELSLAMRKHLSGRDANRYLPVYVDVAIWRMQLGFFHEHNYDTINQIAAISIYRHRARHGDWPASLSEIDPEVLPIPADYYSGEPLRYALLNGTPRLWALGADRDDDMSRMAIDDPDSHYTGMTWFALDEWEQLSEDQRSKIDGDVRILD